MKTCTKCGLVKSESEFALKNKITGLRNAWCKTCNRDYQKLHYQLHKDTYKAKARQYEIDNGGSKQAHTHNTTVENIELLKARYNGMCWSCKENQATVVDHDHKCCPGKGSCGKCIRGMLCQDCNVGLGYFRDSVSRFTSAIEYLNMA